MAPVAAHHIAAVPFAIVIVDHGSTHAPFPGTDDDGVVSLRPKLAPTSIAPLAATGDRRRAWACRLRCRKPGVSIMAQALAWAYAICAMRSAMETRRKRE